MAAPQTPVRTVSLVTYAVLAGAVLLAFGRALQAPFLFDDHALFVDPAITSAGGWLDVWRPSQSRPLTYFTFWIDHQLYGSNAAGYHAGNLLLHVLNSCLVLACLSRLLPAAAAVIAAFVFALHPIQAEPVVYIFARSTLLAVFFVLVSLFGWLRGRYWLSVLAFVAALLAKEEAAAYPVFLALLHITMSRNRNERLPIIVMLGIAVAAVTRVAALTALTPRSGAGPQAGIAPLDYLMTQGYVILRYLQLYAIPVGFSVDPEIEVLRDWRGLLAWSGVAGLGWIAWRDAGRLRIGFWFLSALILLAPTSSLFPANDLAADRRMYLPGIAFCAIAGLLFHRTRYPFLLPAGAIVLGMLSFARTHVWISPVRLWEEAMQWAPDKVRPRIQLSRAVAPEQAVDILLEARRIAPNDPDVATELGRVFLAQGKAGEALREFGRALALAPRDPAAFNNRGAALLALGMKDHAAADFRQALELNPCLTDARRNLALAGHQTEPPASGCR